jgi:hypothetical protein
VPAVVADELAVSWAKLSAVRSTAKLRPEPAVAKPSNNRQTPLKLVQAIFILFPLELMVSVFRVLPVVREVRTIPFVTHRTLVVICIRIGLREVILGVWGDIFRKTILGRSAIIYRR